MTVDPMSRGAVLVVDDDEGLRAELRALLEAERYSVIEASDGKAAIEVLHSAAARAIRLVVLDLVMPCVSGWDVVEHVRHDEALSRIPVLVTSAMPVHGDASGIGATMRWIRKPFDQEHFLHAARAAIEATEPSGHEELVSLRARGGLPSHHDA